MVASQLNDSIPRPLPRWRAALAALVWFVTVTSAFAVVDVRDETWTLPATVPGQVTVVFKAELSPDDLMGGVHFTLALREGNGAPHALVRYAATAIPNLPDAGETLAFRAVFDLDCNPTTGVVNGIPAEATVRFCTPTNGFQWNPIPGTPQVESTTVSGAFGLAVLDENDTLGANPTPGDALLCGGDTAPAALALAAAAARSQPVRILDGDTAATIGVYFDPQGTRCQGAIAPGGVDTLYVLAKLGSSDDSDCGIAGAEFRFAGIPSAWHPSPVTNPVLLAIGNPFTEGVTVVSDRCLRPPDGVVLLYTVLIVADALVPDVTFTIVGRDPPTNPNFPCPFVLACDNPVFTKICVVAEPCFVNPTVLRKCPTTLAVTTTTWSVLKQLYR